MHTLRLHEDAEGVAYWGQLYSGTFDCSIAWLSECVGPEVSVVAREIDFDYVELARP